MQSPTVSRKTLFAKRAFDLFLGTVLFIVFSPLFLIIPLLIFIEHLVTGRPFDPLFYTETRISKGTPFRIVKFNIFKYEEIQRLRNDNVFIHTKKLEYNGSIKRTGFILKQTYFDELPQLVNILKGDMSMVGPRPLNKRAYEKALRQNVNALTYLKAGLTGNFQCYKDVEGQTMKQLDGEYLEKMLTQPYPHILIVDLKILYRTVKFVLRAKGI